jgi:hypothetical protein
MGLAFNTMEQRLLCSDFSNCNVRQVAFPNGGPTAPDPVDSEDEEEEKPEEKKLESEGDDEEGEEEEYEEEEQESDASSLSSGTAGDDAL